MLKTEPVSFSVFNGNFAKQREELKYFPTVLIYFFTNDNSGA